MPEHMEEEASQGRQNQILADVLTERKYQRTRWSVEDDVLHSHYEWVTILVTWLGKAASAAVGGDAQGFRKRLVQVAAICMAAIEALDKEAR